MMDKNIEDYIIKNKVLTFATSTADIPYCANCYYAFDNLSKTLIFLSDDSTHHIKEAKKNKIVAGTIQNGVTAVDQIQGIQFKGIFINPTQEQASSFYQCYFEHFPFAEEMKTSIWGVELDWIKMTDNTLGFGTKLSWEK